MDKLNFSAASYAYAPAYGWHVRQSGSDAHPLLPDQILLHTPLRSDPFGRIHTAAKARDGQKGCLWWVEWLVDCPLPKLFYNYLVEGEKLFLFIWQQTKSCHSNPFRLLVTEINPALPKPPSLWALVKEALELSEVYF